MAAHGPAGVGAARVWAARLQDAPAGWPAIHLRLAWRPPAQGAPAASQAQGAPAASPADDRDAARRLARTLLRQHAGATFAEWLDRRPADQRGGGPVSVAHDGPLSLVAWCDAGALGVDLVALNSLEDAGPAELQATAALYLGPAAGPALAGQAPAAARRHFATAWATLEARLKCLGLAVDEWSPAREAALGRLPCAQVVATEAPDAPARAGVGTEWVARLAWRPTSA